MDRLGFAHNLYPQARQYLSSRQYSTKVWLSITAAVLLGIAAIGFIAYLILTPPTIRQDYYPFANKAEYQQFIKNNPLLLATVPSDKTFTINQEVRTDKVAQYTISLSTKPIKPDMTDAYIQSYLDILDNSHQQALDWIKDQGQDPQKLYIIWKPDPTQMRQILLNKSPNQMPVK